MNIINKIKYFREYCSLLDANRDTLLSRYNVRIDDVYRLYTVYTIDEAEYKAYGGNKAPIQKKENIKEFFEDATQSGKIINGDEYLSNIVNKNIRELGFYLDSIGLTELYGLTSRQRIDELHWKVVVEYKFFRSAKIANFLMLFGSLTIFSVIVGTILAIFL